MHAPISNSAFNPKAKLYKRFTPEAEVAVNDTTPANRSVIKIENQYYRCHYVFSWVNADDMQHTEERPIDGLMGHANRMAIKLNGSWKIKQGSPNEPETDDIVGIGDELWVIEDGMTRKRLKSMVNAAVITMPLRRLM